MFLQLLVPKHLCYWYKSTNTDSRGLQGDAEGESQSPPPIIRFTGTKVQLLTQKALLSGAPQRESPLEAQEEGERAFKVEGEKGLRDLWDTETTLEWTEGAMSVRVLEDTAVEDVMKLVAPVLSVASVPAALTKPLCV